MAQGSPQPPKQRIRKPSATRLMKGAMAAGLTVRGVELDPTGKITVLVGKPGEQPTEAINPWLVGIDDRVTKR
jgi:hypothetical protein